MPAVYDPSALFPTAILNKIDVSSSVTQLIGAAKPRPQSSSSSSATNNSNGASAAAATATTTAAHPPSAFGFFTRGDSADAQPLVAPCALDALLPAKQPQPLPKTARTPSKKSGKKRKVIHVLHGRKANMTKRKLNRPFSIYRSSDGEDERSNSDDDDDAGDDRDDDDDAAGLGRRRMDIDARDASRYVPAREIDASINQLPMLVYRLHVVDVPPPDYTRLRRANRRRMRAARAMRLDDGAAAAQMLLDPRVRRLLNVPEKRGAGGRMGAGLEQVREEEGPGSVRGNGDHFWY